MQLVNEFSVQDRLAIAWETLTDMRAVASCIPGAQIDAQDGDEYRGRVDVRVGPVKLGLQGTATVLNQHDDDHVLVVRGLAKDRHGQGTAVVTITMNARDSADNPGTTDVVVTTELELGGRVAQFSSGVISQVSNRIIKQFVTRLDSMIESRDRTSIPAHHSAPMPSPTHAAIGHLDFVSAGAIGLAGIVLGLALGRALYAHR